MALSGSETNKMIKTLGTCCVFASIDQKREPVPQICTYVWDCTRESIPTGLYARACTHEPVHTDLYEGGCGMKVHFSHRNSHGMSTGRLKTRRNHALRCQRPLDRKMVKGDT